MADVSRAQSVEEHGNRTHSAIDSADVDCERCREAVSADLDREASAEERRDAEQHLAGCPPCRDWADRAAVVTRRTRTHPAEAAPDLVDVVLEARDHGWPPRPSNAPAGPDPAPHVPELLTLVVDAGVETPATSACGCLTTCRCGCQQGQPCRCSPRAA